MRTDPSKLIPTSESTSDIWVNWHKSLRKWFNKTETNTHWLRFWQQRAGAGSTADTYALREYMGEQGVNLTTDSWGEITDQAADVVEWFSDTINMTRIIVAGTVIVGVGLIAYYIINSSKQGKSVGEMAIDVRTLGKRKALKGSSQKLLTS
jgi:hypothetical protein